MSAPASASPEARLSFPLLVAKLTLAHACGTMMVLAMPAIAPLAARAYGVAPALIGYQTSLVFLGVMGALLFGGNLSLRWGGVRVNQVGLGLQALGCGLTIVPHLAFLVFGSVAIGVGYGLLTPSASHVLIRFVQPHRRNVVFSLKQSGMPIGGLMAALVTPVVAVAFGWQWALGMIGLLLLVSALLLEPGRTRWDDDRVDDVPLMPRPFGGIMIVWQRPELRLMALGGVGLAATQTCMNAYTVVMFYEQLGYHLVAAGLVLSAAQAGGVAGRLFWGWLADRRRDCMTVLALLAAIMLVACLGCLLLSPTLPLPVVCALFVVIGSTASGWNGAFLGETARLTPAGQVSASTGGALFFVNVSSVLSPILFANLFVVTGRYNVVFALLAVPIAVSIVLLLAARRTVRAAPRSGPA
jgi:MFS family permease